PGRASPPTSSTPTTRSRSTSTDLLVGVVAVELAAARVEAVLADQLAQVLAIDLRLAGGGRQVHLVPPHQVLDVLALEHLDQLTLGFLERQVCADTEARRGFAHERVLEVDR